MATELERLVVRLVGDVSRFTPVIRRAIHGFESDARRASVAAATVETAAIAMASAVGSFAVASFSKFNKAITESTAIMDVNAKTMESMANLALKLGTVSKQGPEDLAGAYFYLASAGLSAEQSMASLSTVQKFATAGNFSLKRATELAVGAQNTLSLSSRDLTRHKENLTRVSDVLVKANVLAQATTEQFALALSNRAGPTLRAYGKSIEEGVAALAVYAKQNIVGQEAGTFLRRTLLLLSQSALKNASAHRELGFSVFDSSGKMRNLADIAKNLEDITSGMSDETRSATLAQLGFQFRIQQAVLPLIGMSSELRRFQVELENSGGTADRIAGKQMKAFSNQMLRVWNSLKVAFQGLGDDLTRGIIKTSEFVRDSLGPFIAGFRNAAKVIYAISGVITGFLGMVKSLIPPMLRSVRIFEFLATTLTLVISLLLVYRAALLGILIIEAFRTALQGPKGWVILTASIVAATIAVGRYKKAVKDATSEEQKRAKSQILEATGNKDEVKETKKRTDAIHQHIKAIKTLRDELENPPELRRFFQPGSENIPALAKREFALAKARVPRRSSALLNEIARNARQGMTGLVAGITTPKISNETSDFIPLISKMEISKDRIFELKNEAANAAQAFKKALGPAFLGPFNDEERKALEAFSDTIKKLEGEVENAKRLKKEIEHIIADEVKRMNLLPIISLNPYEDFNKGVERADFLLKRKSITLEVYNAEIKRLKQVLDQSTGGMETFLKTLQNQRDVAVLGEFGARLRELIAAGASPIRILIAMRIQKELDQLKEFNSLMERAKQITEEMRSPAQVYKDTMSELTKLLALGAIDVFTFMEASARAMKKLQDSANIKVSVSGFDSVAAGSVEALKRIEQYKSGFTRQAVFAGQASNGIRTVVSSAQARQNQINNLPRQDTPNENLPKNPFKRRPAFDAGFGAGEGASVAAGSTTFDEILKELKKISGNTKKARDTQNPLDPFSDLQGDLGLDL